MQAASFSHFSALKSFHLIPAEAKRTIDAFLAQQPAEAPSSELSPCPLLRPDAHEFQSLVVIEMLKKLLDKVVDERTTFDKRR